MTQSSCSALWHMYIKPVSNVCRFSYKVQKSCKKPLSCKQCPFLTHYCVLTVNVEPLKTTIIPFSFPSDWTQKTGWLTFSKSSLGLCFFSFKGNKHLLALHLCSFDVFAFFFSTLKNQTEACFKPCLRGWRVKVDTWFPVLCHMPLFFYASFLIFIGNIWETRSLWYLRQFKQWYFGFSRSSIRKLI